MRHDVRRDCLQPAVAALLVATCIMASATTAKPTVKAGMCVGIERRILGTWKLHRGDAGLFDEMEFRADPGETPRFNSWLHMRPDTLDAIWGAEKCRIDITTAWRDGTETHMTVVSLTRNRLRVRYERDLAISTYRRIE
jgi:hypothetical protein